MIKRSFIFLDSIGIQKERSIWNQDIKDWNQFLKRDKVIGISDKRKGYYNRKIEEAIKKLEADDSVYFAERFPISEHWRLYDFFKEDAVFIDIEVSGVSKDSFVTVIGLFDGYDTKTMIKGINIDYRELKKYLKQFKMIVSFNGSVFDAPRLKKEFGSFPKLPHMDLRTVANRIGLKGGLKSIEEQLDIKRRNQIIERLYSGDPYKLWRMWRGSGDDHYLKLLVEYNEEDVINLKKIADYSVPRLTDEVFKY